MHGFTRWGWAALIIVSCGWTPITMTLTSDSDNAHADGNSPIVITAKAMRGTTALDGGTVTFKADLPGCSFAPITDLTTIPDPNGCSGDADMTTGVSNIRIYSNQKGPAKITASYTDPVGTDSGSATVTVTFTGGTAGVSSFDYVGADPEQIPLQGSGQVTFLAKDSQGQPVAKVPVTFTISHDPGGASLDPTNSTTAADGTAKTTVTAGAVAGTITIKISDSTGTVTGVSDAIAISGGGINAKNFTLSCPHYNIGGFVDPGGDGLEMQCTVFGSDLNGAFVPNSQVIFKTEAGGVPTSADFAEDTSTGGGIARFTYRTQCKWPIDVPPLAGEPTHPCSFKNRCATNGTVIENRKDCNPRDGLATLIAITTGSEDFSDLNGDGVWNSGKASCTKDADCSANAGYTCMGGQCGEPYVDQGEPYVDANDDGTYNPGEDFYDANKNGKWDGPNGQYDSNTAIWKQVKILWTGAADFSVPWTTIKPSGMSTPGPHCGDLNFTLTVLDINGNAPTAFDPNDAVSATAVDVGGGTTPDVAVAGYADWTDLGQPSLAGKTGQGIVAVTASDSHSCPCSPPCTPYLYEITFSLQHTLAESSSGPNDIVMEETFGSDVTVGGTWQ